MNNITPGNLIDEVKNLISYSITNKEADQQNFENLHRAIIKNTLMPRTSKLIIWHKLSTLNCQCQTGIIQTLLLNVWI